MSIVNDALKKIEAKKEPVTTQPLAQEKEPLQVQDTNSKIDSKPSKRKNPLYLVLVAIVGVILLSILLIITISSNRDDSGPRTASKSKNRISKSSGRGGSLFNPLAKDKGFILAGIMYSEYEPAAIINNRVVKPGDQIDGAIVESIQEDLVKLSQEGQELLLRLE